MDEYNVQQVHSGVRYIVIYLFIKSGCNIMFVVTSDKSQYKTRYQNIRCVSKGNLYSLNHSLKGRLQGRLKGTSEYYLTKR